MVSGQGLKKQKKLMPQTTHRKLIPSNIVAKTIISQWLEFHFHFEFEKLESDSWQMVT